MLTQTLDGWKIEDCHLFIVGIPRNVGNVELRNVIEIICVCVIAGQLNDDLIRRLENM